jgi:hypothetical protein
MIAVTLRPARYADVAQLAPNVRAADAREIRAATGETPEAALARSLRLSDQAWAGLLDGTVACLFGVGPAALLARVGVPWLVGAEAMVRHPCAFLRRSRACLAHLFADYDVLTNFVDARNDAAIRWLGWLGFTFDDPAPYGPDRLPFYRFELRRH